MNEQELKQRDAVQQNLARKLHPRRFTGMSDKMAYIVGNIIRAEWTPIAGRGTGYFSVTSDKMVVSGGLFIGSLDEFRGNLLRLAEAAELDGTECHLLGQLFDRRVSFHGTHRVPLFTNYNFTVEDE